MKWLYRLLYESERPTLFWSLSSFLTVGYLELPRLRRTLEGETAISKKRSETSRCEKPPKINDLKLVNGIGPVVERRLNGVGIYTYAQLSALSPADLAAAVDGITGLTAERIIKQDWIG